MYPSAPLSDAPQHLPFHNSSDLLTSPFPIGVFFAALATQKAQFFVENAEL